MFEVGYQQSRRLLWNWFSGVFTREDLRGMDEVGRVLLESEGPLDCVFDFSACSDTDISVGDIAVRGRQPRAASVIRRVIVASHPRIVQLAEVFAVAQAMTGSPSPLIVRTAAEAHHALGIETPQLRRVEIGWLRRRLQEARDD